MSYTEIKGNLFNTEAKAIVNTVNCVGAMGKGIALEFRRRYPEMFVRYQKDCKQGLLLPGKIYYYLSGDILVCNFAIKQHWRYPSRLEWVESSLKQFLMEYKNKAIEHIAFPWMGAMNGGIPIEIIKNLMRKYLNDLQDIRIEVYDFDKFAPDPLFYNLQKIVNSNSTSTLLRDAGLSKIAVDKVFYGIQSGEIKSLAHLVELRIMGEKSIDNLYQYLIDNKLSQNPPQEKSSQLSLF